MPLPVCRVTIPRHQRSEGPPPFPSIHRKQPVMVPLQAMSQMKRAMCLSPYKLKVHFTDRHVNAQVIHILTGTIASSASSEERVLRQILGPTSHISAAGKIGKLLGERLLLKGISAVSVSLKEQYSEKVRAVIDALKGTGVKCKG